MDWHTTTDLMTTAITRPHTARFLFMDEEKIWCIRIPLLILRSSNNAFSKKYPKLRKETSGMCCATSKSG